MVNALTMTHALEIKQLTKVFTDVSNARLTALRNVSFEVQTGEFLVLLGRSGSGKSTLLRIMSGLDESYDGSIILNPSLSPSDFSFVFQQFALLPWLTVHENIGLGLYARAKSPTQIQKRVTEELQRFGLEKFAHAHPRELSGGMRQRVGIARALATDPKILFMDEPFSELDSFTAHELRQKILSIWMERKLTIIMVTHILPEALELADRIAILTSSPGRIERIVTNHLPRPRNLRSPDFFILEDELYATIK